MASELAEQLGDALERMEQMENGDAAARALRDAILDAMSQYKSGTVKFLYQAGSHDTEHAAMPARAGEYQRALLFGDRSLYTLLEDRLDDLGFGALALRIERVELFR